MSCVRSTFSMAMGGFYRVRILIICDAVSAAPPGETAYLSSPPKPTCTLGNSSEHPLIEVRKRPSRGLR